MEDKLLVQMCKGGNKEAFGRIYEKYRDYLLITAVALSNNIKDSEDAVHDVFVSFAERMGDFKLTGSLKAYLAVCVANRIRNIQNSKRRKESFNNQSISSLKSDDPESNVICNEQLEHLSKTLQKLPQEQREIIVMHEYSQLSLREIADLQKESVNTIKSRYRYGIEKLKTLLESEYKNESS